MLLRLAISTFLLSAAFACAQSNKFDIFLQGKAAGHDTYTLQKSDKDYKLSSRFTLKFQTRAPGSTDPITVNADYTDDFRFDQNFLFAEGTSADMDEHHLTGYVPSKPRTEIVVTYKYQGVQQSEPFPVGPDLVMLNNFDAGAAQAALQFILGHPTPTNTYSVYTAAQRGASKGPAAAAASRGRGSQPAQAASPQLPPASDDEKATLDAKWSQNPAASATLNGQAIQAHAFTLAAAHNKWTFYADNANTLLQVDVQFPPASYIRSGFKLDVSSKP